MLNRIKAPERLRITALMFDFFVFIKSEKLSSRTGFFRNVLTLMSGTSLALFIPVAISPILTRIFTPQELGLLALYTAFSGLAIVLASARFDQAIMLPRKQSNAVNILYLSLAVITVFTTFLSLIVYLYSDAIALLLGNSKLVDVLFYAPLSVFFLSTFQVANLWCIRNERFDLVAKAKVVQAITISVLHVSFGYLNFGLNGLVGGAIAGQFLAMFLIYYKAEVYSTKKAVTKVKMMAMARRYKEFPIVNSWSALLNTASVQLPLVMFGWLYGASVVGYYSLAERVVAMPVILLGTAVAQVFFSQAAKFKREQEKLANLSFSIYKKLLLVGSICLSFLSFYGDVAFLFVFGEEWVNAGVYAQYLSPWMLMVFASSPISHLYTVLEKQKQGLLLNIIILVVRMFSLVIIANYLDDPIAGIIIFSVVSTIFWIFQVSYLLSFVTISTYKTLKSTFLIISAVYIPQYVIFYLLRPLIN